MNITKADFITTDRYCQSFLNLYYKTDVIYHGEPMHWRGNLIYPPNPGLPIIISGHSDYAITNELMEYYHPNVWFCVNKQTDRPNVFSLPLGITNNTNESDLHAIYGDLDSMIQVMGETVAYKNLVYMNFNINTYPSERQRVWDLFQDLEYVTKGETVNTIEGRTQFLREIKAHTFVLCPRGNGIDTHRLWETLYMGSIPILRRDIAYAEFTDLPICFVDHWEEITPMFLESEKERIYNQTWNMDKLKIGYWIHKIESSVR